MEALPPVAVAGTVLEDLPEDALLAILALLAPTDAAAAACACRRLAAAASSPSLPLALALRLGLPPPRPLLPASAARLLRSLHRLRRLLGLWRRLPSSSFSGSGYRSTSSSSSLAAFEWARGTLAASLLVPSARGLAVAKSPFVTLSIDETGETVAAMGDVPVSVNFVGNNHIVVEAAAASSGDDDDEAAMEGGSPPEVMYMHFANRRSPGAGRKRRSKQGRRRGRAMEAEHFVRIADAEPTEARPLQGLWKGISESRTLEFYLVTYDDIGGITCRQVSDTRGQNSGFTPIFWTTNTTFLEQPFSEKELDHYIRREHIQGVDSDHAATENRAISRILCINSSYDVVDHHLSAPLDDMRNVEGRIWLYDDGTFGFGFSGSNSIIDLKHVSSDGCILDALH
ncbi:F-box protein At3g12350 [Oryza glaberrima]|uniref:F-box domain-containing protein n=1 Tax=Oryza glaberrima TaxID=4538 RepID=I1R6M8_ORYGL|nr:F-box protein At3g12350 [Oryza glaberrima]